MEQTVLHTLSSRKLIAVLAVSLVLFVAFFLVGELATGGLPQTATSIKIAKPCSNVDGRDGWFDSNHCKRVGNKTYMTYKSDPSVFYVVLPRKGDKFTSWNQFLLTTMQLKLGAFNLSNFDVRDRRKPWVNLKVQTDLAYWNGEWRSMVSSAKSIQLLCEIQQEHLKNAELQCPEVPHFELDSVQYGYYLINMRVEVELMTKYSHHVQLWVKAVESKVTYQRAKFTQASFSLKLLYCPVSLLAVVIYLLRAKKYRTQMSTMEKSMVSVGATLAFFNFPIEWLTIWLDIPPMMLLVDVRLVIFYGMLFFFTTHFIREQLKVKPAPLYFKICTFTGKIHVADIGIPIVTFLLVFYYLIDRLTILDDHFYCMTLKTEGVKALLAFVVSVGVWTGLYTLHLTLTAAHAVRDIKETFTGTVEKAWVGAVVANILVVWLTILYFFISNIHWAYLKYRTTFHVSGALFTGIVGSWNIFVVAFLLLFSPSEATSENQGSPQTPAIAAENDNFEEKTIIDAEIKA